MKLSDDELVLLGPKLFLIYTCHFRSVASAAAHAIYLRKVEQASDAEGHLSELDFVSSKDAYQN